VVGLNLKKALGWIVVILLVFLVITQPDNAANSVQNLGSTLEGWANSITSFFTQLV
jgi:hypothetical protein